MMFFDKFLQEYKLMKPQGGAYAALYDENIPCQEISSDACLSMSPLVSVKIITYNHEKWIEQCVESVVCQKTSFPYEVVLAEDHSTDSTFDICKRLQSKYPDKIRLLYSDQNVGMFRNGLRAARKARGKYIALLEGDDYWCDENRLEKQVKLMEKEGSGFCVGWTKILSDTTGVMRDRYYPDKDVLTYKDFVSGVVFATSTFIFEKSLWESHICRFRDIPAYDTSASIMYAVASGVVPCLREYISVRRQTGKGMATGTPQVKLLERAIDVYACLWKFGPAESAWRCHAQAADCYLRLVRLRCSAKYGRDLGRAAADFAIFLLNIIPWFFAGHFKSAVKALLKIIGEAVRQMTLKRPEKCFVSQ